MLKLLIFLPLLVMIVPNANACTKAAGHNPEWIKCPKNTKAFLKKLNFDLTIKPKCEKIANNKFDRSEIDLVRIYHDKDHCGDIGRYFLTKDNIILDHITKKWMFFDPVTDYASQKLETPISQNWLNFDFDDYADLEHQNIEGRNCYLHKLKYPFKGTISQCIGAEHNKEFGKSDYDISGDIDYEEGAFKWKDALDLAYAENTLSYKNKYRVWRNVYSDRHRYNLYGNSVYVNNAEENEHYLFVFPVSDSSDKDRYNFLGLAKIEKDGSVQLIDVEFKRYNRDELIEMAKQYFGN